MTIGLSTITILMVDVIVDDRPSNLSSISSSLMREGFQVVEGRTVNQAIAQSQQIRPDLILLDVVVSGTDGLEICQQLKANPITQDIPVIVMVASADEVPSVTRLSLESVTCITKPSQARELTAHIQAQVQIQQLTQRLNQTKHILEQATQNRLAVETSLQQAHEQLRKERGDRQKAEQHLRQFDQMGFITADGAHLIALRQSEAKHRALLQALPDLVIRANRDGVFLDFISTDTFGVFGQREDFVGTRIEDSLPADLAKQRMAAIQKALATQKLQIYEQEILVAEKLQIEEVRVVAYDEDEVLILIRDISERKHSEAERRRAEQALQDLNADLERRVQQRTEDLENALNHLQHVQLQLVQREKMSTLGNLVAGIAHEINNPIGFLRGNLKPTIDYIESLIRLIDLYQTTYPNPDQAIRDETDAVDLEFIREDLPKLIRSMTTGINRLYDISTSLRTFSRSDQHMLSFFNLHEGLDSTLLILQHRLKANTFRPAIQVNKHYGNLPLIQCFVGLLNQVFMNLLANAIDALDESSRGRSWTDIEANPNQIQIKTDLSDDQKHVHISIRDNGIGMSEEVRQRIFDHLFTTKAVGQGTGLGLSIARQIIVEKHQGSIDVSSTLGQGTEFLLTLPVEPPLPHPPSSQSVQPASFT